MCPFSGLLVSGSLSFTEEFESRIYRRNELRFALTGDYKWVERVVKRIRIRREPERWRYDVS